MADENKRTVSRVVYMTEDEFADITRGSQTEGLPFAVFIRAAAIDRARRILADRPALPVAELQRTA